jgi:drug/metabolite transporter (DMT)-like permease
MENANGGFFFALVRKYLGLAVPEGVRSERTAACMGLAFAVLCWAANTVLARGVVHETGPMALSFWRWVTAWFILLPFGLPHVLRERKVIAENRWKLVVLSLFSVAMYNSVLYVAAQFTTAMNMSIVTAAFPAITVLAAWILIGEAPEKVQIAGIFISALGMLAIIFKGSPANLFSLRFGSGDLLVVGAVVSWSLYSVLLRKFRIAVHPMTLLTVTVTVGTVMILPFYVAEAVHSDLLRLTAKNASVFLFLALFPSLLAYFFWNNGVLKIGPGKAAFFLYLLPVFGSLLAFVFLGEEFQSYHLTGSVLVFVGLYLAIKR